MAWHDTAKSGRLISIDTFKCQKDSMKLPRFDVYSSCSVGTWILAALLKIKMGKLMVEIRLWTDIFANLDFCHTLYFFSNASTHRGPVSDFTEERKRKTNTRWDLNPQHIGYEVCALLLCYNN